MVENEIVRLLKETEMDLEQLRSLAGLFPKSDRLIAQQQNSDASLLNRLAASKDKVTRKYVALNPNTPTDTLLKLAPEFPGAFFMNPVFDWLLLENPNLLIDLKQGVLKNILKRPDCPLSFQNWAAWHGDKSEQLAVAMRPDATLEILRLIANGPHIRAAEVASGRLLSCK
ncbi:MAG: hypothetical protein ABIG70_01780 [Pseudomonadota bacterium]